MTNTTIEIYGTLGGHIWMPNAICGKPFKYSSEDHGFSVNRYSDGSTPTLREIVLEVTNDGDFQSASIVDAVVTVTRRMHRGDTTVKRSRSWDIRHFPSVKDCVVAEDSDLYYEISDCLAVEL